MNRLSAAFIAILSLSSVAIAQSQPVNELSRAVVQVTAPDGSGSGVLFERDGELMILTNRHVAEGYTKFVIGVLEDLHQPVVPTFTAILHSFSPELDAALLRVTMYMDGREVNLRELRCRRNASDFCIPEIRFASDVRTVSRGNEIAILGYPDIGDDELIYSAGHIASILYEEFGGESVPMWFRTNATISSGNSGGLAFNPATGEMLGMPTSISSDAETSTSLGRILSVEAVWRALEPDRVMTTWEEFLPPNDGLDPAMDPHYGGTELAAGFEPDLFEVEVLAGGSNRIHTLPMECTGYVASAPDFRLDWSGETTQLHLFFEAFDNSDDATMIVQGPGETWYCNDDGSGSRNGLNPAITLDNPAVGTYFIWVGSFGEGDFIDGTLRFSEVSRDDF